MANSTCSITSLSDLLDKANTNLLNLTTVVASCPGVCSLIWGKGNPDLLGIGAMVSYMMQGVLALLCGPVIGFVYGRISNKSYRLRLSEITHFFLNTSAGFNIPVAIAAAFCMAQSTPFFDQSCMTALVGMQSVTFVCVLLISLTFEESRLSLNFPTIICYIALQPLLVFVVEALQTRSLSRWASESAVQLLEDCKSYSQIPSYVIPSVDKFSTARKKEGFSWFPVAFFALALLICALLASKTIRFLVLGMSGTRLAKRLRNNLAKLRIQLLVLSIVMLSPIIYLLSMMQSARKDFKALTGPDSQDDEWGFGQIVAVYLWIPLCLKIVSDVLHIVWDRSTLDWVERIKDKISQIEGNDHIDKSIQTFDDRRISETQPDTPT